MQLKEQLTMQRCPHCNIANPNIYKVHQFNSDAINGGNRRTWISYVCQSCGGALIGSRNDQYSTALQLFPERISVDSSIPSKAKEFLSQSIETIHAPAGSIMLSASSIDAMLKEKGYQEGSLYKRIEKAVKDNLITEDMSLWAHQIRLEANDQRHADEDAELPNEQDAKRIVDFALALVEILYVLPNRVKEAIEKTKVSKEKTA